MAKLSMTLPSNYMLIDGVQLDTALTALITQPGSIHEVCVAVLQRDKPLCNSDSATAIWYVRTPDKSVHTLSIKLLSFRIFA